MFTGSLTQCAEFVYNVCLEVRLSIATSFVTLDASTNLVTDGFIHTIDMRVEVMNQRFITDVWNANFAAEVVVFTHKFSQAFVFHIDVRLTFIS